MATNNSEAIIKVIFFLFLVAFFILEVLALNMESHYKYDIPMSAVLLIIIFIFRQPINLSWFHFILFSLFLLAHCLGMFDFYNLYLLGIEYEYWIHGFFGFLAALIMLRALNSTKLAPSKALVFLSVLIIVFGISAAHELYEFAGAMILGQDEGVLFIGAGDLDQWDTQKDMLNNVMGGVVDMIIYLLSE